jgi:hypothetical protein
MQQVMSAVFLMVYVYLIEQLSILHKFGSAAFESASARIQAAFDKLKGPNLSGSDSNYIPLITKRNQKLISVDGGGGKQRDSAQPAALTGNR